MSEHEEFYLLMMEELDGEISINGRYELESHLHICQDCMQEWQALLTIDTLFRQTPALSPVAGFAERTLARLPNRQSRMAALGAIYVMLLLGGTVPAVIGLWLVSLLGPVLSQPTLLWNVVEPFIRLVGMAWTVLTVVLSSLGSFILQEPMALGSLLMAIGAISVWSGLYQQLVLQPRPMTISMLGE